MNAPVPVIVNAAAGSASESELSALLKGHFKRAGIDADVRLTRSGADLDREVRRAIESKPTMIVVGGGDGTLNTAASLLVRSDIALGILPLGTLNHLAKDLHIPLDLAGAVATIAEGHTIRIDVGAVNHRFFINNSGLGLYPQMVRKRDAARLRLGHGKWPAFIWATLAVLRRYPFMDVLLNVDGVDLVRRTPFVFVGNNQYVMEGFRIGERASLTQGELCLYVAHRIGRLGLLRLSLRALFGRLDQGRDFDAAHAKNIQVTTPRKRLHVSTDGEICRMDTPLRYCSVPAALSVVVPRP
ncbi:MAG: diacylglycerol kinase family lipid kinase [Aromatoleum sp.]|nr:diacylglycerol kinase family lipid kinase [Aromatoleum sp.]